MPFVLTTDTNPGTAQWVAGGAVTTPYTGLMFVDNQYAGGSSDGSIVAPFITIQAALDAIGPPTTVVEYGTAWVILVTTGFYDEDLTIPQHRSISIEALGGSGSMFIPYGGTGAVYLSDPTLSTSRTITLNVTTAVPFPGVYSGFPGVQLKGFELIDGISLSSSGPYTGTYQFTLCNVTFINFGVATIRPVFATGWTAGKLQIEIHSCDMSAFPVDSASVVGPAGVAILSATNTNFDTSGLPGPAIVVGGYGRFSKCILGGSITFTNPAGAFSGVDWGKIGGRGFFDCLFGGANVFTSTAAGDCLLDATSFSSFASSVWTLAGAATIVSTADQFFAGNTPAGGGDWAAGGNNTTSEAIARIASVVADQHGAIP